MGTASTLITVPSASLMCSNTSHSSDTAFRKVASSWDRISSFPGDGGSHKIAHHYLLLFAFDSLLKSV